MEIGSDGDWFGWRLVWMGTVASGDRDRASDYVEERPHRTGGGEMRDSMSSR